MRSRIAVAVVLAASVWTQPGVAQQKERCGTRMPGVDAVQQMEQRIARSRGKV